MSFINRKHVIITLMSIVLILWTSISSFSQSECSSASPINCNDIERSSTVGGIPVSFIDCNTSGDTAGAHWYTFTGDGYWWTASTVNNYSNYDTRIWILEGTCDTLICVGENDDFVGLLSRIDFQTSIGTTYYVVVGGFDDEEGDYELNLYNEVLCSEGENCSRSLTYKLWKTRDWIYYWRRN